ncbi:MAG: ferritin-like domain-containing protein [Planctomycetota bacterium]|jgi:rubrerythrin
MDIFEFAMKMELEGEDYYHRLADHTADRRFKTILTMLADDEVKHYNALREAKASEALMPETTILDDAESIFAEMSGAEWEVDSAADEIELYEKALEIEEISEEFYREKAQEAENERHRNLFLRLAEEEKKHCFLVENIIEFVSRPQMWLENAEFCHLEEY